MDRHAYDEQQMTMWVDMKILFTIVKHGNDSWVATVTGH
jgi:hypothetical protein